MREVVYSTTLATTNNLTPPPAAPAHHEPKPGVAEPASSNRLPYATPAGPRPRILPAPSSSPTHSTTAVRPSATSATLAPCVPQLPPSPLPPVSASTLQPPLFYISVPDESPPVGDSLMSLLLSNTLFIDTSSPHRPSSVLPLDPTNGFATPCKPPGSLSAAESDRDCYCCHASL